MMPGVSSYASLSLFSLFFSLFPSLSPFSLLFCDDGHPFQQKTQYSTVESFADEVAFKQR